MTPESKDSQDARKRANRLLGAKLGVAVVAMLGFSYLLVPLYDIICDITGLNGRTGVVEEVVAAPTDDSRMLTVEFIAHTADGRWRFAPETASMQVRPGKSYTTHYIATSLRDDEAVSRAVPSVAPVAAAVHFNKVECFCFTSQAFQPGEQRKMPVTFVVNESLPGHIKIISLAYTFYDISEQLEDGDNV